MAGQVQGYRLSQQQRRLWWIQQQSQAYRSQCVLRIQGELNEEALGEAVSDVIKRHEILRTTFNRVPGIRSPFQVINESGIAAWRYENLTGPTLERQAGIETILLAEREFDFDLAQGPTIRLALLTVGPAHHILAITVPSICADSWTLIGMFQEIARTYAAHSGESELACEPGQYADFCEWQNDLLNEEKASAGKAFWPQSDLSALLSMKVPYARQQVASREFEPHILSLPVEETVAGEITAFARAHQVSDEIVLLSLWQVLLWRLSGGSDVVTAVASNCRRYQELQNTFGLFAKWLPVASKLNGDYHLPEVVDQINRSLSESIEWEDYFLWGEGGQPSGGSQEFPSICFESCSIPSPESVRGVTFSLDGVYSCFDRFKLKLSCVRKGEELLTEFHYDARVFSRHHSESFAAHFHTLLASVAGGPGMAIGRLEILGEPQRQRLLVDLNDTATEDDRGGCIHRLIEKQAASTPDRVAVVFEDEQLSYSDLDRRARQLADHLIGLGVGPETPVAIYAERSLEIIVGMLGVLKAGGFYVPLDPAHPKERLATVLEETHALVLLCQKRLLDSVPSNDCVVVALDMDGGSIGDAPDEVSPVEVAGANLAYAIFTSGSTGRPKGVVIEHRQLSNYILGVIERLELPAEASYATVSTFAADLGNTAIFPSLCMGGCLHIVSQERAADAESLASYIDTRSIDCLKIVPSHLEALLTSACSREVLPRRRLIMGGEACGWNLFQRLERLEADCLIFNHYGPTETTVGVATCRINADSMNEGAATVPIGGPIPNTQAFILDAFYNLTPIEIAGELHIGGAGLGRGYLNRPDLTAEKFIPNRFAEAIGGRLYRTGDLTRVLRDLKIEFLGRTDSQIKFHGHRVELNEIRLALKKHQHIRDGVVVVLRDDDNNAAIVAYYVSKQELDVAHLRAFLSETLIQETLPHFFVHLRRLPLTLNGKINYSALPTLAEAKAKVRRSFVAPGTSTQKEIAAIWLQYLSVDQIGIHDNFFELGGHSLLATRIVSRLRQVFGIEIPLRTLFETPTIADLAAFVDLRHAIPNAAGKISIEAQPHETTSLEQQLAELGQLSEQEARDMLDIEARSTRPGFPE